MPRSVAPWYRKSRSMWYLTHRGQQIPLGISNPDELKNAQSAAQIYLTKQDGPPIGEAVAQFLARSEFRVKPETLRVYRWLLKLLVASLGPETPIAAVTTHKIEKTSLRASWSDSTRHDYLGVAGTFLRDCGYPMKLRRPPQSSRGAGAVWSDREFWQVYGASRGDLKPLLAVLRDTGARPGEVAGLSVSDIDWTLGCAVLKVHKNAKRGKTRVLHFPQAAKTTLEAQRMRYTSGPLFRSRSGGPFKPNTLHVLVRRTVARAGLDRPLTLYGLRHGYITRALGKGFSSEQIAALVGNSAAVIERNYNHLGADTALLRSIADRVVG